MKCRNCAHWLVKGTNKMYSCSKIDYDINTSNKYVNLTTDNYYYTELVFSGDFGCILFEERVHKYTPFEYYWLEINEEPMIGYYNGYAFHVGDVIYRIDASGDNSNIKVISQVTRPIKEE